MLGSNRASLHSPSFDFLSWRERWNRVLNQRRPRIFGNTNVAAVAQHLTGPLPEPRTELL